MSYKLVHVPLFDIDISLDYEQVWILDKEAPKNMDKRV